MERRGFAASSTASTRSTIRFELEVEQLRPLDDNRVLASVTLRMESERGFPQSQALTNVYDLDSGKLWRVRVFTDRAEALEAAGLSE